MRALVMVVLATGCATEDPPVERCAGASVATCGNPATYRCNGGCGTEDSLCMGPEQTFGSLSGNCRTSPTAGSLAVTIDGAAFQSTQVAAASDDEYMQISASANGTPHPVVMLRAPAVVGVHDCSNDLRAAFGLYADDVLVGWKVPTNPQPCTVTITSVGAVGERITGTFAVTLIEHPPATMPSVLTDGTFDVERGPF